MLNIFFLLIMLPDENSPYTGDTNHQQGFIFKPRLPARWLITTIHFSFFFCLLEKLIKLSK